MAEAKKKTAKKTTTKKAVKKITKKLKETVETPEEIKEETQEETTELKKRTSDRSVLLRELKKKAKELEGKFESSDSEEIKEELKKKQELLIPLDDYVKTGIHLGTKVITPDMKKFVYRRRADSIGVLNTNLIDEQIKKAVDILVNYSPEEVILACKREAGWEAAQLFEEVTGIKAFTKKYPGGMLTNTELEMFYEPELVIVGDQWIDRNALGDALKTNKKVIMLADTNNFTKGSNLVIPCNNKGSKSIGLVFYLLAKGYLEKRKIKKELPPINAFTGESDDIQEVPEVVAQ